MDPDLPVDAAGRTGVDAVVRELLQASFGLMPDHLAGAVDELARRFMAADQAQILVVDLDQVELRALEGEGVHLVDDSPAGMAFRDEEPVTQQVGPRRHVWVPILDSAERIGVLFAVDDGTIAIEDWLVLASMVGELIVSKEGYGDALVLHRRRQPVSLAAEMRWSLLPPLTFSAPSVCISGILQPSHVVAGDAFDYAVDSRTATIGIFDAMGHGLQAARLANMAVIEFRNARRGGAAPAEILTRIDQLLTPPDDRVQFVTGQIVTLDLERGEATILTAGHPPPARLRTSGSAEVIEVQPAPPLGLGPARYVPTTVSLDPGDALLLLSDGVFEARDPDRAYYGMERGVALAQQLLSADLRPAEVLRRVIHDAIDFQAGHVTDDATLAMVRWQPAAVHASGSPSAGGGRTLPPAP